VSIEGGPRIVRGKWGGSSTKVHVRAALQKFLQEQMTEHLESGDR